MGDWEPDQHLKIESRDAYVWIVPAAVSGEWVLKDEGRGVSGTLSLAQRYQRVGGTLALGGKTQPLLGASVDGEKLSFGFIDDEGNLQVARMKIAGNSMTGTLSDLRTTVLTASKR